MTIGVDGSRSFVSGRTGTENYSYQLLLHLAKIDQTNTYIIYLRPSTTNWPIEHLVVDFPPNFQFKVIGWPRLWTQIGLAWQTFRDDLDLLFVPSHTLPLVRKPGLKTVMTVHDLGAEYLPTMHQIKQQLYLKFITDVQLKTATRLIAVSEATKQDLIKKVGIKSQKIEVVYEGSNFEEIRDKSLQIKDDTLKRLGLEKGKYFLFVGTIQPRKNLARVIRAFKGLLNVTGKDFKLVLVGKKGWLSDEIYKLPKELGIDKDIIFTGFLADDEVKALYSEAAAFVYPSLFEGFGLPILEAFAYDCPVITSNVSSMSEVAGDAALLVDPCKIDEILQAMVDLSADKQLRYKLAGQGRKQLQKFSWEKAAGETLKVFEGVAKT